MQDKEKVTFYLQELTHQQLKIRSAIDSTSMSELAERAIRFYLAHSEIVENAGIGHTHQVYNCPSCTQSVVIRNGELMAVGGAGILSSGNDNVLRDSQGEALVR
ncbi:MAG: hypothetical protein ACK456_01755 [Pseudanabaenaceae cyanobacterium]|jgi:hypothetical protein